MDSAIVRIKVNNKPRCEITPLLKRTIKACFLQRRKNIKNSLLSGGFLNVEHALQKCGFNVQIRGEKLSIEDFCKLSKSLEEVQNLEHNMQNSEHDLKQKIIPIKLDSNSVPKFEKINELKDWIFENLPLLGAVEIKSNKRKVQFSKTTINRSLKGVYRDDVKRNSYFCLKQLVESAVFAHFVESDEKHFDKVFGQELYYNVIIYNNKLYGVQINIDIPKSETPLYIYAGHKIKIKEAVSAASEVSPNGVTFVSPDTAIVSITDIEQLFKPKA